MPRISVGYQETSLHPLWLNTFGMRLARLMGADSLWVQDHFAGFIPARLWTSEHTQAAAVVPSSDGFHDPIQVLTLAATRMRGIDLGTAVTEPFRRHPMSLAQTFVTLDHISKGHAILGIGNGERLNVEPYGIPWRRQVARLEEALAIVRLLWESGGKPVDFDGEFWCLRDAVFDLPLYHGRPPRIWIAAHAPKMLGLTGRFGDGWLPTLKTGGEEYRHRLDTIRRGADQAQRSMEGFVPGQMIMVALGESRAQVIERAVNSPIGAAMAMLLPEEVWRRYGADHPLGSGHKGFIDIVPARVTDEQIDDARRTLRPEMLEESMFAGSPSEIRDEVEALVDAGCRHVIISNITAVLSGATAADFWRLGSLIRKLRRLGYEPA